MKYTPPLGSLEDDAPYVDGNPSAGIRGSVVPAAPFNQVQRELVNVITKAGLSPSDSDLSQLYQAIKKLLSSSEAEVWRKSMIGSLVPMAVSTLPGGFGKPDGSLFLFEDYPELKEKYDTGGFNGMLLEANASAEDKAAWVGKWVKHSEGIGLYAPRLQGLFLRNAGTMGKYNKAGLPNLYGIAGKIHGVSNAPRTGVFSESVTTPANVIGISYGTANIFSDLIFNSSAANNEYGAQSTVTPASTDLSIGIYLGSPS